MAPFDHEGLATERAGRNDVLAIAVADHKHISGRKPQSLDPKTEDSRIGFPDSDNGALDNRKELAPDSEILQHGTDIAIKIRDERHRIGGSKLSENHSRLADTLPRMTVAIAGNLAGLFKR